MYPGQFEIVSEPLTGPPLATETLPSLPPPTVSPPPQAAIPKASATAATAVATHASLGLSALLLLTGNPSVRLDCSALPDHVHVLRLPTQGDPRSPARQRLALGGAGVRAEHGDPHVATEGGDHLRRRAQIDRALDHALDVGPAAFGRSSVVEALDVEFLGPDDRVHPLAGRQTMGVDADRRPVVEADLAVALDHAGHQVRDPDEAGDEG